MFPSGDAAEVVSLGISEDRLSAEEVHLLLPPERLARRWALSGALGESLLGGVDNRLGALNEGAKGEGLFGCELGENLSIELDVVLAERILEPRVAETMLPGRRVGALQGMNTRRESTVKDGRRMENNVSTYMITLWKRW